MAETGRFCVNVLGADQLATCQRFASRHEDKFEGISHGTSPGGLPLLDDVLAWIECDIARTVELGDHLLVVGAVRAMQRMTGDSPLIFYRGGYHMLAGIDGTLT
jgi:flavin reductase (DIM6/NTAB) family NADH-FMN oxidoreductase RutF